jgi:D-glycero-D-manno-heptose 1,7-bisphosphate phosphatase
VKRIVFLDRDGVIVRFPGKGKYVTRLSQVRLIPRAARALALLTKAGYEINVISNQGCVSRGLITRSQLKRFTDVMLKGVRAAGGRIRRVYYCLHQASDGCACKKPGTLLLKKAVGARRIDRRTIFFVGDSAEDIGAGKNFGLRTVLVLSGRNKRRDVRSLGIRPDFVKKDLWETAQWLTKRKY